MRGLIIFLLLVPMCFSQTVGSRRYAEKTLQGYSFGPYTYIAPYNNSVSFTTVSDTQLQPPTGVTNNNIFNSTSDFTVLRKDDATTTFATASNVGTIVTGTAASADFIIGSTASSFPVPNAFVQVEVNQTGPLTGTDTVAVGLTNAGGAVELTGEFSINTAYVHVHAGGVDTVFGNIAFTRPSSGPYSMAFSLFNAYASLWLNTGSGWTLVTSGDLSTKYDPRTSGLSGFQSSIKTFTSQIATWKFSNLKSGYYGGTGIRDNSLVVYPDGRPYMQGSKVFLLATLGGSISNAQYYGSGNGIFSYDVLSGALTYLGTLGVTRGSGVYEDQAGQIIYDPETNTERLFIGNWANQTGAIQTFYVSQSISTDDWLANSAHITPSATQMSFPNAASGDYDANAACTSWNYSIETCGLWLVNYTALSTGLPRTATSTSDPSANSWTGVLSSSANTNMEGGRTLRTATTYLGNGAAWQSVFSYQLSGEGRLNYAYNQAGTLQSPVPTNLPAGAFNPAHVNMFSYGNTEYLLTFTDTFLTTFTGSLGNLAVASTPKYSSSPNWPKVVNEGTTFTSASSASVTLSTGNIPASTVFTLASGDLVVFMGRGGTASVASATATDSLGDTFTCASLNSLAPSGATGWDLACYSFVTHSGTATFTVTPNVSSTFMGLTVLQIRPGFVTIQDNAITFSNIVTGATTLRYTSSAFSTSAQGLIVVCGDLLAGAGTYQLGSIGPYYPNMAGGLSSGAAACEATTTSSAQSAITGTMASGSSVGWWGGAIFTFK